MKPQEFHAYHGTPDPNVRLTTAGDRIAYFTDNRKVASEFAFCVGRGVLLSDDTNIDKQKLLSQGYDGIVCMNVLEPTYIVAFHERQFEIIERETLIPMP